MTNAWVATCIAGIIQTIVAFALGEEKRTHPAWVHVSLFPEALQKGKEKTHILELKYLCFLALHFSIVVWLVSLNTVWCLAVDPLLSDEGYLYPDCILCTMKKEKKNYRFF